jgi:hypothetical protein
MLSHLRPSDSATAPVLLLPPNASSTGTRAPGSGRPGYGAPRKRSTQNPAQPGQARCVWRTHACASAFKSTFLARLRRRWQETGCHHDDNLYLAVCDAYEGVQRLSVQLHYLSCTSGVWKPKKPPAE